MQIIEILKKELQKRSQKNPNYSIRAFAKSLGIDQSFLTKALNGSRKLGPDMEVRLAQILGVSAKKINQLKGSDSPLNYKNMEDLDFEILGDWTHFAILELMTLPIFKTDTRWIASKLNISTALVRPALQRLKERGLLTESEGQLRPTNPNNSWINTNKTSEARKALQKQLLNKAVQAIDEVDFKKREAASLTLACDPSLLPEIKARLQRFKDELQTLVESRGQYKEVYQLCLSFFPLTDMNRSDT